MDLNVPHRVYDSITGIEIEVRRRFTCFTYSFMDTSVHPPIHSSNSIQFNSIKNTQTNNTQQFYHAQQGERWDRRFTVVAGLTQAGVDACGMLDRGNEIWLNWSNGDDASLHQFRCVVVLCWDHMCGSCISLRF